MELAIVFAVVTSLIVTASSHPKNSDVIPKDYYKRQILQPIPGYIPVYIRTDGEPLVRTESKKPLVNVHPPKAAEPKEKNLSADADKRSSLENDNEKPTGRGETDEINNSRDGTSAELERKPEQLGEEKQTQNEKESEAEVVSQKTQTVP